MAEIMTFAVATEAWDKAKRLAKYGHRWWLVWTNTDGTTSIARRNAESIEAAMAAVGPEGKFSAAEANTGTGFLVRHGLAKLWLKNAKGGYLTD